jgi:hypothetical protein
MNAENPSVSKFQLVTATQLPHRCLACGRSSDGRIRFLDFGLSLDTEDPLFIGVPDSALGVIYICEDCGKEAAALLGCLSPQLTNQLNEDLETSHQVSAELENENDRLHRLVDSYSSVLASLGAVSAGSDPDSGEESGSSVSEGIEQGLNEPSSK